MVKHLKHFHSQIHNFDTRVLSSNTLLRLLQGKLKLHYSIQQNIISLIFLFACFIATSVAESGITNTLQLWHTTLSFVHLSHIFFLFFYLNSQASFTFSSHKRIFTLLWHLKSAYRTHSSDLCLYMFSFVNAT